MINTNLHNYLIEKDMEQKKVVTSINIVTLKRKLLIERLKNYSFIVLFLFFVLLLLLLLYRFIPEETKQSLNQFASSKLNTEFQNKELIQKKQEITKQQETKSSSSSNKSTSNSNKTNSSKKVVLKNGIDYIKQDNLVYKREWKDGVMVKMTKLASTIKESQKYENIPQFSHEKVK